MLVHANTGTLKAYLEFGNMGEPNVRWECPRCGYLLYELDNQCSQCKYVRTGSDKAHARDPDDTNSWIIHRLEMPSFEKTVVRWDRKALVATVVGIGIATLLILLFSMIGAK